MPEGTRAKGCVKLRRCSKFKTYYKVQFTETDKNRDQRMNRHLANHPNDRQTAQRYGTDRAAGIRLTSKGRKRVRRHFEPAFDATVA